MLRRFSEIRFMQMVSQSLEIGTVSDLLLDDDTWNIRYVVASEDPDESVRLISPAGIEQIDFQSGQIEIRHSPQQIRNGPEFYPGKAIFRDQELALVNHFGWPIYWLGRSLRQENSRTSARGCGIVANLRSANDICGYRIDSEHGFIGYLMDLVIDMEAWRIEYATADPESWVSDESTTLSTRCIDRVNWNRGRIKVDFQKSRSPSWSGMSEVNNPTQYSGGTYWLGE